MDYAQRLARLRERMGQADVDVVYLPRGANLFYLTGVRRPLEHGTDHNAYGDWASGAYIARDGGVVLLAPRMGGAFYEAEAMDKPWIARVRLIQETESPLAVVQQTLRECAARLGHVAIDDRAWGQATLALQEVAPEAVFSSASALIAPLRMIKDDEEMAAMRRASELADLVFARTVPILRPGVSEFEVAREVDYQFRLAGAEYTSFETGISFVGPAGDAGRGTTRASQARRLSPGDSVTFDFGCVLGGYCSDFGRSAFVGEPPAEYRRIHELVLAAQRAALEAMRAERITASEANAVARRAIADAGYDDNFTHRLGHGIGVTVHEPPFLDAVDQTVLQDRMVFTVEPSVRVPGRFGNRVEDVVVVTPAGGEPLNRAAHDLVVVA
ncbi:MAG TPA: Xaa-Pro peptidase family protein [Thermomicrobiales bacterium]|nr:Xaa-Pro peptidase family protein [Thermomicrobiales bacterium]